jgi:hypothetical protein
MTFDEFLDSKKIDALSFRQQEPVMFADWENNFNQIHPNSFSSQKLYLINAIRRRFAKPAIPKNQS